MSFLDRIAAKVTPAASEEDRAEARRNVKRMTNGEPWLAMIVEQHEKIEGHFRDARNARDAKGRVDAMRALEKELTGHATAEEAIVYPVVSEDSGKTHAGMAYEEHAMTKVNLAKLERIDPDSKEWMEKLDHIESAVRQHMYQEESSWLPDLVKKTSPRDKEVINQRFTEEYERYMGPTSSERISPSQSAGRSSPTHA
ncbi:MAG: hemerythrin domain-containing protein [Erythrobacter sp.]|jgi:hemerythrin superfamily protein|nr:hemerythrin domain-containing protein [Erythrobacter sp.]